MANVNCLLTECIWNKDCVCQRDEITLSDDHYCDGGCDEGWEMEREDDD